MRVPYESRLTLSTPHTSDREGSERCWSGEPGQVVRTTTTDTAHGQPFEAARPSTSNVHEREPDRGELG